MSITVMPFGKAPDGRECKLYTLTNASGASLSVSDWGAHLVGIRVPDKNGTLADVVLGYDSAEEYLSKPCCLGDFVGRYANRIGGARFELNGKTYTLYKNNGEASLHGGREGFSKKWYQTRILESEKEDAVYMTYVSHDGEEGYPGKMRVQVSYAWDENNTLTIRYLADTDKDTVINLTNHAYFNMAGHTGGSTLGQIITVHSQMMTEVDEGLIPTGVLTPLKNTPLDLNGGRTLKELLSHQADCPPIAQVKGLDFNFCLDGEGLKEAASLYDPASGRKMTVFTTEPGIQLYSGQSLNQTGKGGAQYAAYDGIAFETQHWPDSPNHPDFPSTVLKAGDTFSSQTRYAFTVC